MQHGSDTCNVIWLSVHMYWKIGQLHPRTATVKKIVDESHMAWANVLMLVAS